MPLRSYGESDDGDASEAGGEDDDSDDGTDVHGGGFLAKNPFFPNKKNTKTLLKYRYFSGKRILFCLHNISRSRHGVH